MLWPSHDGDHDGDPQSTTGHTHTDARGSVWAAGPSSGRAGGSYLPAPAVRPPMRRFSMNPNRMITGTMAMSATANRYCQSWM